MDRDSIHEIAETVAKKTIRELFLNLGINTDDPSEMPKFQKDLAHLRNWRESTEAIKQRGMMTAITFLVTATLGWLIFGATWPHGH